MSIALAPVEVTSAQERAAPQQGTVQVQPRQVLRSIAPGRGRLVPQTRLAAPGGGAAVTCCTNWNTSTGGTGCATYPDVCPDDQFTVECGDDGCW